MYTMLRTNNAYLGCVNNNASYIIGFQSHAHAKLVRQKINSDKPRIELKRGQYEDITEAIKRGLEEHDVVDIVLADVVVDTNAQLTIKWDNPNGLSTPNNHQFDIVKLAEEEFMSMPFFQNVGVVIPIDMMTSKRGEYKYLCHVVDPSSSVEMFRSQLAL